MSAHYNRQETNKRRVLERLASTLHFALLCKWTHSEFLGELKKTWESPEWKGLTQCNRAWCSGWLAAKQEAMEREHLENRHTMDGVSILSRDIPDGRHRDVHEEGGPSGLYWKGTDGAKPWYEYVGDKRVA